MANRQELIERIIEKTNLTKKDTANTVDALFETIQDILVEGDKVSVIGFGTFEVRDRAARTGRNPQTGEALEIAASRVPAFKAGKHLKDLIK